MKNFLNNLNIFLLPNGIGHKRLSVFEQSIEKYDGTLVKSNGNTLNLNVNQLLIIIIDENTIKTWDNVINSLKKNKLFKNFDLTESSNFKIVKSIWLTECLKTKSLIDYTDYELIAPKKIDITKASPSQMKRQSENSDDTETVLTKQFKLNNETWTCSKSSNEQPINLNSHITDKLEAMSNIYTSTKDKYRALGYQKAIHALKLCKTRIDTFEDAIKLPGIGTKLAEKIAEISSTGQLEKLNNLETNDEINALKLFTLVHGIGPSIAKNFVTQGYRTLEDLSKSDSLNRQQKIGIKHFEDFQQRIPRIEVEKIENYIKKVVFKINDKCIVETCGSYRRGKETCGDVDILLTHPDSKFDIKDLFYKLIQILHEKSEKFNFILIFFVLFY
jgi:DNA polymerase lambda